MNGYTLDIDTHEIDEARLALTSEAGLVDKIVAKGRYRSEDLLPGIEGLLKKHKLRLTDIRAIIVHTGPGSFTGIRIGVIIARILGLLIGVPVNGKSATGDIRPVYTESKYD